MCQRFNRVSLYLFTENTNTRRQRAQAARQTAGALTFQIPQFNWANDKTRTVTCSPLLRSNKTNEPYTQELDVQTHYTPNRSETKARFCVLCVANQIKVVPEYRRKDRRKKLDTTARMWYINSRKLNSCLPNLSILERTEEPIEG